MLIGRSRRCDVVLRDSQLVSRRHCRLEAREAGWFLRDLGSQNGTWIDGERIDHAFLTEGDRFVVGDVVLRIRSGAVEAEGTANPRTIRERPRLRDQGAALALVSLPILAGIAYLAITAGGDAPDLPGAVGREGTAVISPPTTRLAEMLRDPAADPSAPGPSAVSALPAAPAAGDADPIAHLPAPADPPAPRYSQDELIAIAERVDRELAAREVEMAALLASGGDPRAGAVEGPGWDLELELAEGEVAAPPLADSWSAIAGEGTGTGGGETGAAPSRGVGGEGTGTGGVPPEPVPGGTGRVPPEPVPGGIDGGSADSAERDRTEVARIPAPAEPLFSDAALADLVREVVAEGIAKIDRYHVREVSLAPLRPLIGQLSDLDGAVAASGLLELRAHTLERLREVYRRSREIAPDAARSEQELAGRPKGGAEEREDELTVRLAEIVAEHLETLVLIRDEIDAALLGGGKTAFILEALRAAIDTREEHLLDRTLAAAASRVTWETVPLLIEAVGNHDATIRRKSRETLETITGERPGTSRRAWREWWQARGGAEKEA